MDPSKSKPTPFVVSIEIGKKKPASIKKKTPAKKKKDDLLKGQLTLTQMPCMTSPFAAAALPVAEDDSTSPSLSVFTEPVSPVGKNKKLKTEDKTQDKIEVVEMEDKKLEDLTVIYTQKSEEEEVVFTVGDLVEMQHHVLDHYLQLGLIKQHHGSLVEVYWLWHAYDGNNDLVCIPKKTTFNPSFLKKLANFHEPLDPSQFNWWKYKGVMTHFDFFADGRG